MRALDGSPVKVNGAAETVAHATTEIARRVKVLTRREAMERLRMKPAFFSKLTNGKVKGLPPLRCIRAGRKQLFLETTVDQWAIDAEEISCNGAH